jgi:outer membrane biosynthesis protein TonB
MRKSLISSFALHAAILVAALFVLPNPDQFKVPPQDAVQVDISHIGDVTKKVATSKAAEPTVKKAAPPKTEVMKKVDPAPKVAEEIKTAAKEPVAEPPPEPKKEEPKKEPVPPKEEPKPLDPDPLKDLLKKVEEPPPPKKEEVKKAEETPPKKIEEKKKPVKKQPKLNTDDIAAFLNKTDDQKTAPKQPSETDGAPVKAEKDAQGSDDAASATLADALSQKLNGCWSVPPGAREAHITVTVHFLLNTDGSVAGAPEVLNGTGDPLFGITAQSAVSAVMECQSYSDIFPPDKYDLWKDNTFVFNPNMMSGT